MKIRIEIDASWTQAQIEAGKYWAFGLLAYIAMAINIEGWI